MKHKDLLTLRLLALESIPPMLSCIKKLEQELAEAQTRLMQAKLSLRASQDSFREYDLQLFEAQLKALAPHMQPEPKVQSKKTQLADLISAKLGPEALNLLKEKGLI